VTQEPRTTGTCRECGKEDITLTSWGAVRVHGPRDERCEGSGKLPDTGDDDVSKFCVLCRSGEHDRTAHASPEADAARARIAAGPSAGPNPYRPPLSTEQPFYCGVCIGCGRDARPGGLGCTECTEQYGEEQLRAWNDDVPVGPLPTEQPSWDGVDPWHNDPPTERDVRDAERVLMSGAPDDVLSAAYGVLDDAQARGTYPAASAPADPGPEEEDPFASPAAVVPDRGPWFASRYDGDCDGCGADFGEGDDIRADGSGGWEAKDCCGEDAAPAREDVPRRITPKVPLNGNHRYVMPHPQNPRKQWTAQRVTTFTKLASETFALEQWALRNVAVGMAVDPSLVTRIRAMLEEAPDGDGPAELVSKRRPAIEAVVTDAKTAAGDKDRARKGTRSHKLAEELDAGHRTLDQVPPEYRADLAVYLEACQAAGYTMLSHLIERTTGSVAYGVMGTFDRVVRCPDGLYRVFDQKTGKIRYGQKEIAAQLACYVTGCNETGIAQHDGIGDPKDWESWRWVPLTDDQGRPITVETDYGIVAHVPYGQGECTLYPVPLDVGREAMNRCRDNREWQKSDACFGSPIPVPALDDVPDPGELPGSVPELVSAGYDKATVAATVAGDTLDVGRPAEPFWEHTEWVRRFSGVAASADARALYLEYAADPHHDPQTLAELAALATAALARAKAAAARPQAPEPAKAPFVPVEPVELPWTDAGAALPTWEQRFGSVTTKAGARELYLEYTAAQDGGSPGGHLDALVRIANAALARRA
jgi:hypothetical protein